MESKLDPSNPLPTGESTESNVKEEIKTASKEVEEEDKGEAKGDNNAKPFGLSSEDFKKKEELEEMLKTLQANMPGLAGGKANKNLAPLYKDHKFWDTQPVPKVWDEAKDVGEIETKKVADVRPTPYALPEGFEWVVIDLKKDEEIEQVYTLLTQNYVEDDDNMFRFDYSKNFLRWALMPPDYIEDWHIGVKVIKTKKLVGFISGIPMRMMVHGKKRNMSEINFLCVHKKLRDKRLAPVLIKEITRRVNIRDTWQAVYTAGIVIPTPVSQTTYYHRSLRPKKLVEVKFTSLPSSMPMSRFVKLYKLPENTDITGLRPMQKEDVKMVHSLLITYLKKFSLYCEFTKEEVAHWLLPRHDVINTYVVEDPATKKITDFVSFYSLPSTIIGNDLHNRLNAAYAFYTVSTKTDLKKLMKDALVAARDSGYDVYNALDIMDNATVFEDLKFGMGDGNLQYYLYNWKCPTMKPNEIGIVLV